ncbi:unnamed protein product [Dicrocoelium dendriticum]|nr:unnamed protein product [Dicrocoelium dendriticum]
MRSRRRFHNHSDLHTTPINKTSTWWKGSSPRGMHDGDQYFIRQTNRDYSTNETFGREREYLVTDHTGSPYGDDTIVTRYDNDPQPRLQSSGSEATVWVASDYVEPATVRIKDEQKAEHPLHMTCIDTKQTIHRRISRSFEFPRLSHSPNTNGTMPVKGHVTSAWNFYSVPPPEEKNTPDPASMCADP